MATASPTTAPRQAPASAGYSPPLTITLELAGRTFDVAVTGQGFIQLRSPATADAGEGTLRFQVGDESQSHRVVLPDGLQADRPRQAIRMEPARAAQQVA